MPDRRRLLQMAASVSAAGLLETSSWSLGSVGAAERQSIASENALPGTQAWMLQRTRIDPATKYRCPWIEGYTSHCSIQAGETLQVMVSTQPAADFSIEFYRLGYYGGQGGRLMHATDTMPGRTQPVPQPGMRRLMDCGWEPSYELTIPNDWPSGVYVGRLREAAQGIESYVIFIVRDTRSADFVFQCSDFTWQAYNRWPSQYSLYDDGQNPWHWGDQSQVSFNRPYGKYCQILDAPLSIGSGEFFLWEFPFVYWLEREGYDVTYISNHDLHKQPSQASRGKGFLSVGHDEYWTIDMYRAVQQAIASGTNVGFFSGNAVCGRVAWDAATRAFHRVGVFGPPGGTREFSDMSSLEHTRPYANELIGAHSTGPVTGGADWICTQPDHWIYAGTGMAAGDRIPGVIGWEWHGDPANIAGLEIVASGPTQSAPGVPNGGTYTATVYPGPKGNFVFNAATCWWADGLAEPPGYVRPSVYTTPQGHNPQQQRITKNILERMLGAKPER